MVRLNRGTCLRAALFGEVDVVVQDVREELHLEIAVDRGKLSRNEEKYGHLERRLHALDGGLDGAFECRPHCIPVAEGDSAYSPTPHEVRHCAHAGTLVYIGYSAA